MRTEKVLGELALALLLFTALQIGLVYFDFFPIQSTWLGLVLFAGLAALLWPALKRMPDGFGWANRVTFARAILVLILAAGLLQPERHGGGSWIVVVLAGLALALDGVDGWLARRRNETSAFGARFDMETDAALILTLCAGLWLAGQAGVWVLVIGLMRYGFLLASLAWPWLAAALPPSFRRKLVCVWQVAALIVAMIVVLLPPLPSFWAGPILLSALAALVYSFMVDIAWLFRHHRAGLNRHWSSI